MSPTDSELLQRVGAALAGRYTIERVLGAGSSGIVLLARDERHNRDVAIKVLKPEIVATVGVERFLREIDVAAGLQHPNIVPLFDSGAASELPYLVMPYLSGTTLRDRIRVVRQLAWDEVLRVTREVADALDYAHRRGVIHRDIKPANILLAGAHSYVSDFGLAFATRADGEVGVERLTGSGIAVGTAEYMSPEQATADTFIDARADVYALGCVVYEMLAGVPPYTGRTVAEVLSQHLTAAVPSVRTIRHGIPAHADGVLERALAKAAADRFGSANAFASALEYGEVDGVRVRGITAKPGARKQRALRVAVAATLMAGAAVAAWLWWPRPEPALDPRRVVVFPLRIVGNARARAEDGEGVATYVGYAIAGADPLHWVDGVRLTAQGDSNRPTDFRALARSAGAAFYIDGDILFLNDSSTVRLAVHAVAPDSVVARATARGASGSGLPVLGVRAAGRLLPALLDPGHAVDVSLLADRHPEAITSFLNGEREYRAMHFERAIAHYARAVAIDSAFSIAAVKGTMASSWLDRDFGLELVNVALKHEQELPPHFRLVAHGLRFAQLGMGDSAVARMREATLADPNSAEAWHLYGDALYHQLPAITGTDSLAEAAYRRAREVDPEFTPALFHLTEIAMRRGDLRSWDSVLVARQRGRIDSAEFSPLNYMYECLADSRARSRWKERPVDVFGALAAGKVLAARAAQPSCARHLLGVALAAPSADVQERWGTLLTLQSLLVALADTTALDSLLHAPGLRDLPTWVPMVFDAVGAGVMTHAADSVARDMGTSWSTMRGSHVWLLGVWHARNGNLPAARRAAAALESKRDSSKSRSDSLFVHILAAHTALAAGDTALAISRLQALSPRGSPTEITWQPWDALAGERMLLAELLLARGAASEALHTASLIDALEPVVHNVFLRRSLELRARAAEQLARPALARAYRTRLTALSSG